MSSPAPQEWEQVADQLASGLVLNGQPETPELPDQALE